MKRTTINLGEEYIISANCTDEEAQVITDFIKACHITAPTGESLKGKCNMLLQDIPSEKPHPVEEKKLKLVPFLNWGGC